jgi:hypothetical protein
MRETFSGFAPKRFIDMYATVCGIASTTRCTPGIKMQSLQWSFEFGLVILTLPEPHNVG